jgi:hypothetical protein
MAPKYARPDSWLVENARKFKLQNRLGFVVTLARRLAEVKSLDAHLPDLRKLEHLLDDSRLAKEDVFSVRPARKAKEGGWERTGPRTRCTGIF